MAKKIKSLSKLAPQTRLALSGREYTEHGFVNPAVYHASTVLYRDVESLISREQTYVYGRRGTPTTRALEAAIADLEGGSNACLCPSGLAAVSLALLALVKTGDHVLMTDAVYRPAREFCDSMLKRMGVETTYYDPQAGEHIAELIGPRTTVVYTESPGSQTFEVQDLPAIARAAHAAGAVVVNDNTWATGHYFRAIDHGADVVVMAGTKYIVGHSDAMMGMVVANEALWPRVHETYATLGLCAGPDDAYLTLRGLRTLDVRLARHMENAIEIARWLAERPEVECVLHPALPGCPGHDLWRRDFSGASGLFSIVLKPVSHPRLAAMLDGLALFGMGFSWGGFESLVIPFNPEKYRSATHWPHAGPALRFHIGLEDPRDLIADLEAGFARLAGSGETGRA